MNEQIILKAEKQGKDKGYSGAALFEYLQGYSDGFNNFKKSQTESMARKEGVEEGKKEADRLELARLKRKRKPKAV